MTDANHIWLTRKEAEESLVAHARFAARTHMVPVGDASGRIAAKDVSALRVFPDKPASRWDGIAVRYDAFQGAKPDFSTWREGVDYRFSNTGVCIEGDFDTVVRIEETIFSDEGALLDVVTPKERGQLVIPVGSEMGKGDVLVRKGQRITPFAAASLARGGYEQVEVIAPPRVAFVPTGNELVDYRSELPAGKNVETNSIMVASKLQRWGADPVVFPLLKDDPNLIAAALRSALC